MRKKKKGLRDRLLEWQVKPLKILVKEVTKGFKEALEDEEKKKEESS